MSSGRVPALAPAAYLEVRRHLPFRHPFQFIYCAAEICDKHDIRRSSTRCENNMNGVENGHETPVALPSASAFEVSDTITIQPPLTRRGHGPALVILVPSDLDLGSSAKTLDPPPLQKWAEEGFTVAQLKVADGASKNLKSDLRRALEACPGVKECEGSDKLGLICM